jgi:hypothetical protein
MREGLPWHTKGYDCGRMLGDSNLDSETKKCEGIRDGIHQIMY